MLRPGVRIVEMWESMDKRDLLCASCTVDTLNRKEANDEEDGNEQVTKGTCNKKVSSSATWAVCHPTSSPVAR